MKLNKIVGVLTVTTLIATSIALAQNANVNGSADINVQGNPPPPGRGGFLNGMRNGWKDERHEIRNEFREDRNEAFQDFKEGMKERRDFMHGSSTQGMATPTPWKNFRDDMKNIREDMRGKMASLTADQLIQISGKLGITVDELKIKLASGTPLRTIVGDKISREEMMKIMPMMGSSSASGTRPMWGNRGNGDHRPPQGFVNQLRNQLMSIFGGQTEGSAEVSAEANTEVKIPNFFKKLFNF